MLDSLESQVSRVQNVEKVAALNALGKLFWYKSPAKNRFYSDRAFQLATELQDTTGMIEALKGLGVASYLEGDYDASLSFNIDCLKLAELKNDQSTIAGALNNMGMIYGSWQQYDEAIAAHQRALKIAESLQDTAAWVRSVNNMGAVYQSKGKYQEAIVQFQQALYLSEKIGDPLSVASTQNNIGEIYYVMGNYEEALIHHLSTLAIAEKEGFEERVSWALHHVAKDYMELGRTRDAERLLQKSLYRARSTHLMELIGENTRILSVLGEKKGRYFEALTYFKQFHAARDSILNEQTSRKLAELQTRYAADKKEQELMMLRQSRKIQDLHVARLNKDRLRLFVLMLMIGGLAVGVIIVNRILRKRKNDLEAALAQIKRLQGLIPICSHCKKIRDDQGYWNQLETYITENSEAVFSHGICPDCMEAHYPEFSEKSPQKRKENHA